MNATSCKMLFLNPLHRLLQCQLVKFAISRKKMWGRVVCSFLLRSLMNCAGAAGCVISAITFHDPILSIEEHQGKKGAHLNFYTKMKCGLIGTVYERFNPS